MITLLKSIRRKLLGETRAIPFGIASTILLGRLDDALVVAIAIRTALKSADAGLICNNWPGPRPVPNSILRRAKGRARPGNAWSSASV